MRRNSRDVWQIAAVYAGAVLGAGFASGQELMVFFVRYGVRGLWGGAIAGGMFALCGAIVLGRAKALKIYNFQDYLHRVFGAKIAKGLYLIVELFLAVSFCIMIAGGGALFQEQLGIPQLGGALFTALVCFIVLQGNLKGLTAINSILVPFMLCGILFTCVVFLLSQYREMWLPFAVGSGKFFISVFLYVSFNMISASAVLVPLSRIADSKSGAVKGGLLGGFALLGVIVLACLVLYAAYSGIVGSQLPLLTISKSLGSAASVLYAVVLYMAMLTTAAANGFSVVEHFSARTGNRKAVSAVLCLAAIPLSLIPFSQLIESCYTLFGILGLFLLCGVVYDWFRNEK